MSHISNFIANLILESNWVEVLEFNFKKSSFKEMSLEIKEKIQNKLKEILENLLFELKKFTDFDLQISVIQDIEKIRKWQKYLV
jgi:hypothetical protein